MAIHNQTDYDLIKQYLNGNTASFESLINRHKNRVFSYILLVVKNRELAEDIFQDTFIKVVKSLQSGSYKDDGRFVSWVMRIAHNLIIDYYRKEKHLKTVSNDDSEMPLFNSAKFSDATIEQQLVTNQIHTDIKHLIDRLPEEQKEVVLMRYYYDMSFKEIADFADVSINTALGRMRYALINLRKLAQETKVDLTRTGMM